MIMSQSFHNIISEKCYWNFYFKVKRLIRKTIFFFKPFSSLFWTSYHFLKFICVKKSKIYILSIKQYIWSENLLLLLSLWNERNVGHTVHVSSVHDVWLPSWYSHLCPYWKVRWGIVDLITVNSSWVVASVSETF